MHPHPAQIESLEDRIAPAMLLDLQTVRYLDENGDTVLVKTSKGVFNGVVGGAPDATDFIFAGAPGAEILQRLELSDDFEFQGARITVTVTPGAGGDGLANIGWINARKIDLAEVAIRGDLGRIDVGDGAAKTPGLGKLKVETLGGFGIGSQEAGGNLISNITGRLGELSVNTDILGAQINVTGGKLGTIGRINVGRDVLGNTTANSGAMIASGSIGPVKIGRDLKGGGAGGDGSGRIESGGTLGSVTIGRDFTGGAAAESGVIRASHNLGAIFIGGDFQGGGNFGAGLIETDLGGDIKSVTIRGEMRGGAGDDSGKIQADSGGKIGPVKIGTDPATDGLFGGGGIESGAIEVDDGGSIASVTIFGSLVGGLNDGAGSIQIEDSGNIGPVRIMGDLTGGTEDNAGSIVVFGNGSIASVTIDGNFTGGSAQGAGSIVTESVGKIGPVKIGGTMTGSTGGESAFIGAREGAIGSVSVGGTVAGSGGANSGAIIADLDIGAVTIGGGGDLRGGAGDESGAIISRHGDIVSVKIAGSLSGGSGNVTDSGLIQAEQGDVKKVEIAQDLVGGSIADGESAFNVGAILGQNILSVTIGDNLLAGTDAGDELVNSGAVRAEHQLKSLTVQGDIVGNASHFVSISGRGQRAPTATTDLAIGSVKVTRDVAFANLLAGVDARGTAANADAQIGSVSIGGDLLTSNLAAGVKRTDGFFGNLGDASIIGTPGADTAIISKIASVTIGGGVDGTIGGVDSFGIVAAHVVKVLIGGLPVALAAGAFNNLVPVSAGAATGDVFVLEVV